MKKPTEYDDFNWVESRQNCSAAAQFKFLQQTVEANVTERKKHLGENAQVKLSFESNDEREFRAMRKSISLGFKSAVFRLRKDHIVVQDDDGDKTIKLTPVQNDDGECRFKVDGGGTFLRWQVAQKALEDILF